MILKMIIGAIVGAILWYLYYKKIGCPTGTCPITKNRYSATIYGALLGIVISNYF